MKVVPLLVGSSLVVLTFSQTVNRIPTTYLDGDHALEASIQQQPITLGRPFQSYLHSPGLPVYTQSLTPIQSIAPISEVSHHGLAFASPQLIPISRQARISEPVVLQQHHQEQPQVFAFQTDPYNQIQLLHRDEPPRFEQVSIKDPKVSVFDVQKPAHPPATVYQVRREQNPPATIEFVNEGPNETQVTVLDDTRNSVRVEEVNEGDEEQIIQPRQRVLPRLQPVTQISAPLSRRRVFRNNY